MSKYYCEYCTTEFYFYNNGSYKYKDASCPVCHTYPFRQIPDYETPAQYEKRTGKKWNGVIWTKGKFDVAGWIGCCVETLEATNILIDHLYVLCAQSPEPPPDDWKPEEGV